MPWREVDGLVDEETWKFINTFAPWLSAIGSTLSAVATSLWLAQRDRRVKLSVRASLRIWLIPGGGPRPRLPLRLCKCDQPGPPPRDGVGHRLAFCLLKRREFLVLEYQGAKLLRSLRMATKRRFRSA